MIVAYVAIGFFLIFAKNIHLLEPKYQTTLGIVILLYAGFRLFTLMRKKRQMED
jgi:hypothetical protein